jgi:shikimate kinase
MFASPSLVNAQVPRDGVKPRRELGLAFVSLGALDDAHEGFLQQILGGLAITDEAQDEVVDRLAMARQQYLEGANLALLVHDHQVFVGCLVKH